MLNFFKRTAEEPEDEQEIETNTYNIVKNTLGKPIIEFINKTTFVITAQNFSSLCLKPYWAQREKDKAHITTIAQGIRNSRGLFHPFILANIIPREEFVIIDGQHRYEALSYLSQHEREQIWVQVDVINFEKDDDEWILQNYEWINTSRGITKRDLQKEKEISLVIDKCTKMFKMKNGRKCIGDFVQKNKQNSRLNIRDFKVELLKRLDKVTDLMNKGNDISELILNYNKKCDLNQEEIFKNVRIGSKVREECIERKFWLGINFPQWLDIVL